jgi:hypothetical protein
MYSVDERDVVVPLTDVPQSDVGAPLPTVVADDYRLVLEYLVSDPDPNWDGSYVNVVGTETEARLLDPIPPTVCSHDGSAERRSDCRSSAF